MIGEKLRSRLGRTPATSVVAPVPPFAVNSGAASTIAPLVAMSGGVCSDHWLAPAGRTNSCQNRSAPDAAPIGTVAHVAPAA